MLISKFLLLSIAIYVKSATIEHFQDFENTNQYKLSPAHKVNGDNTESKPDICTTESCVEESAKMRSSINEHVNPCDNFYEFACGNLIQNTVLADHKSSQTSFSLVQEAVDRQLQNILTEEPQPNELNAIKLAKIFTKSCMDEATLNEKGVTPMMNVLEMYGGWPVVKGDNWKSENWDWLEMSKRISSDGLLDLILHWGIGVDSKNSSRHVLIIDRMVPGLPRELLLTGLESRYVKDYYDFMVDVAVMFGASKTKAESELLDSLRFEIELANITMTYRERQNLSLVYNSFTIQELQNTYPYVDWLEFFKWHLRNIQHIDENETVIVVDEKYLQQLNLVLQSTSKRTIANYFSWRIVLYSSNLLNDVLHNRRRKYFKEPELTSDIRLSACIKKTMLYLSLSAGSTYVRKHFDEKSKKAAIDIVKYIHEDFIETLQNVPWMDEMSKISAINKANAMHFDIAYPDELLDDNKLEQFYDGLKLQPDSLLRNMLAVNKFFGDRKKKRLRAPVSTIDWEVRATRTTKVDAFYAVPQNTIQMPAAVLQNPVFSVNRPMYLNFGGIGWAIAHEITHGFDSHGRKYDPNGNLANWWQNETIIQFNSRAQCFVDQYSRFRDPNSNLTVNGQNTLGENIADNGAIKGMYSAYQKFIKQNGADPILPGLNYTANQLFWISSAQLWCEVTKPMYDRWFYQTNSHAPSKFR